MTKPVKIVRESGSYGITNKDGYGPMNVWLCDCGAKCGRKSEAEKGHHSTREKALECQRKSQ